TGDDDWLAIRVKFELLGIGPNVGRILGHEDRQIADNADAALVAVTLQREPLPEEEKLVEHVRLDFVAQLFARALERSGRAANQRWLPLVPRNAAVVIFESTEERVIFEPVCLLLSERFEVAAQCRIGGFCITLVGTPQDLIFELLGGAEIHSVQSRG